MTHIYITHFQQPEKMKHTTEHKVGMSLLSHALSDLYQIQIDPDEMDDSLGKNEYGKPYLKNHPEIHFNISHTNDLAVCAIGNQNIGVDVEAIKDFSTSIFRKVLTKEEQAFYDAVTSDKNADTKKEWFFRFWTLKEARIKHAGMGLSMSMTSFSFTFATDHYDDETRAYPITCSDKDVYFSQQILEASYVLSVCSSTEAEDIKLIYL